MRNIEEKRKRTKKQIEEIFKNKYSFYYHWLPETNSYEGGVLNFRKLNTLSKDEFRKQFEKPWIQISPFFVKDIVSRFSSYYARQGQPDIEIEDLVDNYTQRHS